METNNTIEALLKKQVKKEAMKKISSDYPLTDELLKEYCNDLDWEEVSENSNIKWTAAMIDRWGEYLNWKTFSERANEEILIPEIIEKFKDRWDWSELSANSDLKLTYDLIDKYIDRWDWNRLINRGWYSSENELYSIDFLNRYVKYIPMEDFEKSNLWDSIVEEEEKAIKKAIMLKDNK